MRAWSRIAAFFLLTAGCGSSDPELRRGPEAPAPATAPRKRRPPRPELDLTQVVFSLRGHEEEFERCAGEPRARGYVRLRWRVTGAGNARNVKVLESTLPDQALTDCVREKVSELKFPRTGRSSTAHWTFVFGLERRAAGEDVVAPSRSRSKRRSKKRSVEPGIAIDAAYPGFLEPTAIESVVESGFRLYAHCYRDGLSRHPTLDGALRLKFVIAPEGSVREIIDEGSDLPDQRVINCVAEGFFALVFPKPERGPVHVKYRMLFDAS